jgi:hypothetical protein
MGCTSAPDARAPRDDRPIAMIHTHRCARCHALPEPGVLPRDRLEAAFSRHRKRVQLAEGDWHAMVDYLASAPGEDAKDPATKGPRPGPN